MTFTDALERVRKVYAAEKKHAVRVEISAKHMGWAWNGRTRMFIAAMKQYGLLVSAGGTDVRVSDQAAEILVYPEGEPRRRELIRQLAMQPRPFQQVIAKYGTSLPSDASLQAYLQLEMGFTDDACPVFIRVLRHAIELSGVDADHRTAESVGPDAPQEATQMPQVASSTPPPPAPITPQHDQATQSDSREHHKWKLAEGVWAEMTISGNLGPKGFAKLKKYVDLIEVSDDETAE